MLYDNLPPYPGLASDVCGSKIPVSGSIIPRSPTYIYKKDTIFATVELSNESCDYHMSCHTHDQRIVLPLLRVMLYNDTTKRAYVYCFREQDYLPPGGRWWRQLPTTHRRDFSFTRWLPWIAYVPQKYYYIIHTMLKAKDVPVLIMVQLDLNFKNVMKQMHIEYVSEHIRVCMDIMSENA